MILIDPGLTPDTVPDSLSVRRSTAVGSAADSRNLRLPSTRTLARFFSAAQTAVRLRGQVNVLLTTDAAVRRLNRSFRGIDRTTDVLSFPAAASPVASEQIAGDLAISVPTARRQAVEQGHSLSTEIKVLILHGLLHLAGYDHESDSGRMARRERRLRARLRLPQGLIERAGSDARLSPKSRRNHEAPGRQKTTAAAKARKPAGRRRP